jgi:dihydroorotase
MGIHEGHKGHEEHIDDLKGQVALFPRPDALFVLFALFAFPVLRLFSRFRSLRVFAFSFGCLVLAYPVRAAVPTYEVAIVGGRVMDPAARFDRVANVGISGSRIAVVTGRPIRGRTTVRAAGLVVAPGFIDMLSGSNPEGDRYKAMDGVTTVLSTHGGPVDIAGYYAKIAQRGALVNYGTVVGHGSLRTAAGAKDLHEPATPAQVRRMAQLADAAMRQGALGVGFGIEYIPATSGEEVMELAAVAARYGTNLHAHIRLPHLLDPFQGINELIAASAATGVRAEVVHIGSMAIFRQAQALQLIDRARARGIDIAADVYPYDAWMTRIESALFEPGWREKYHLDYKDLVRPDTGEPLTAETFAAYRKQGGWIVCHQIPEAEIVMALRHPWVCIGSDGAIGEGPQNHPRSAGTFCRVLGRYVREQRVLPLMTALAKMTVMPADRMAHAAPAMARKGRLERGMDADITVFDPRTVADRATYKNPKQYSAGIRWVFVNGVPVVREGQLVPEAHPGRPIWGRGRGKG